MVLDDIIRISAAFAPVIWLVFSLGKLRIPAYKASFLGLIFTVAIAFYVFKMPVEHLGQSILEGALMALFPIIWVIVSAIFVYNITISTGSMEKIKNMLAGISHDRRVQSIILAFSFGGFLEAVAGFGTAVAIPAGILSAMGFNPLLAATACLIANTIPVAFGVLGIPVITLSQVTGLSLSSLSIFTAVQLIPFILLLPMVLIFAVTGSFKNIKGVVGICIASAAAFALGQTATAVFVGPELAAVVGSLLSLAVAVLWARLLPVSTPWVFEGESGAKLEKEVRYSVGEVVKAWSPYILILVIILATRFIPFLGVLNKYPFVLEKQFYFGQGGKPLAFQMVTSGGTVLFISAFIGGLIQGASLKSIIRILISTIGKIKTTIITVICIVALAKLMGYSGMVGLLASSLAFISGRFYPLIAPFIGAMGTFITGSDTSSNVLFGNLQKQTAMQLGINQEWLTAANATGATAGKMMSPQSISIATAATGLSGKEGSILNKTMKYCVVYVVLVGILVFIFAGR